MYQEDVSLKILDSPLKNNDIWYNKSKLLSHSDGLFYFVLGGRGTGKTFTFKKWALQSKSQTVWVRRYMDDIEKLEDEFLTDMYRERVIDPEAAELYKIENHKLTIDGIPKVFFVPLSLQDKYKSIDYGGVNQIIFDEVFVGNNKRRGYLKNEVWSFLELYETINRLRLDGRPDVRAIFLANKTSWVNPYFTYWHILPFTERFKTFKDGLIVVENYSNREFADLKKQTPFGRLISGTTYGDYAIDNEVWFDDNALLGTKPDTAQEKVDIHYKGTYIGIWTDNTNVVYCCYANNHNHVRTYGLTFDCLDGEIPLIASKFPLKDLKEVYEAGNIRFEDNIIKYAIFSIIQSGGKE